MLYRWRKIAKERNANNGKKWEKFQHSQQQLIISLLLQVSNMKKNFKITLYDTLHTWPRGYGPIT